MGSNPHDIITERNSEIRELELENDLLRGETGSLDLFIQQLQANVATKDARIAALSEELERVKTKWESGEEWYIYNRDRGDARIRGPYSSNIIASAVRDEMETYGQYGNENLVIMTEPKEPTP